MTFQGFDPAAVKVLDQLPGMLADEYAVAKPTLVAGLTRPGAALIAEVADGLDADLTVVPRSSVSPLHRDLRFAGKGAPRYKDHLLLTTWEGESKKTSPKFWIRIDAHHAGFASGIGFTPEVRGRWRERVGSAAGASLAVDLARLEADHGAEVAGEQLKNVPAPYDTEHPRSGLLRRTGFQVRFAEPLPPSIATPGFGAWCIERLNALMPVHRWLLANVVG